MSEALPVLNSFNLLMQAGGITIHLLYDEMQMLYQKILMAFLRRDVVVLVSQGSLKDLEECLHQRDNFLRLEHCDIGINTEAYLQEVS